ncbi:hypothetical protein ACIBJF_53130 [Streptomyces sp. NPDC050743]|uniref:hypothetical protein n=1 Tax=Streptomyces sp. NPDC050743 TaxID=3365634 RepID=UPI0037A43D5E
MAAIRCGRSSVANEHHGRPSGPAAEQRAEDRELFARLQADEFRQGPHLDVLRDRLWRYGWNVLRSWTIDGSIIARCHERHVRFPSPYTEVEEIMRRADVRVVAQNSQRLEQRLPAIHAYFPALVPLNAGDDGRSRPARHGAEPRKDHSVRFMATRQKRDVDPVHGSGSPANSPDKVGVVFPSLRVDPASPVLKLVELGRVRADVAERLAYALR